MSDLRLDLTTIPEPLRPVADLLADKHRDYVTMLEGGKADPDWARARIASINLFMALVRQPMVRLLAQTLARHWPTVQYHAGGRSKRATTR